MQIPEAVLQWMKEINDAFKSVEDMKLSGAVKLEITARNVTATVLGTTDKPPTSVGRFKLVGIALHMLDEMPTELNNFTYMAKIEYPEESK